MKISILITTYNAEKYIQRCIKSIMQSSYANFEIIIIDNNSSDSSLSIVKQFKSKKIKIFSKSNLTIYQALNFGIKKSKGKILCYLGADDCYLKNTFSIVAKHFQINKHAQWIVGGSQIIYDEKKIVNKKAFTDNQINLQRLLRKNIICSPSVFFSKKFFNTTRGFDERYKYSADYDLWLRFMKVKKPVVLKNILSIVHFDGKTLSERKSIQMSIETIRILLKNYGFSNIFSQVIGIYNITIMIIKRTLYIILKTIIHFFKMKLSF